MRFRMENLSDNQSSIHANKGKGETGIGLALGARGTPTFFINGLKLMAAHPFETFRIIIEDQLKTKP